MLKNLQFKNDNRAYDIEFHHIKALQIKGESSTGKTLLANDLKEQRDHDKRLGRVLVITVETKELLNLITQQSEKEKEYNYVVIDNADILLDEETDRFIWEKIKANSKTYWIIIGRKFFVCTSYRGCQGILKREQLHDGYRFTIDYETEIS